MIAAPKKMTTLAAAAAMHGASTIDVAGGTPSRQGLFLLYFGAPKVPRSHRACGLA
jgi:hypothetical protein